MFRLGAALILAASLAAPRPARVAAGTQVVVSAAASLADAMTAVAGDYERAAGTRVVLNVGPSSGLARQIVSGAPVDVFLSADEAQMDVVARAGLVDPSERVDLLGNQLVVVMPADRAHRLASPRDLAAATFTHIALADPEAVPAGVYAKQYLESLGLWTAVAPKVVPTLDVRAALAAVDSGDADAAFVYRTDAAAAHHATVVFEVPLASGPRIAYPAAVLRQAPDAAAARALFAYLRGPKAASTFERFGFIVDK